MTSWKYNTGFVLSGGGARGFAHLGFLQALNDSGIYPDVITGASAGAIAGVLYADGHSPRDILKIMNTGSRLDLMRPVLPREGLLQISGIMKLLNSNLRAKTFSELKIPLIVSATDINNGKVVYFSEGELLDIIQASSSIPVLFQPVKIGDSLFVDGGVLDNFPIRPIENSCKVIIGSFVNQVGYLEKISGLISIAERTFMLSLSKEFNEKARRFDLYVAPQKLKDYKILDTLKASELFDVGYEATMEKLENFDMKKLLSEKGS